jgi:AcrR family transcriptional regulator
MQTDSANIVFSQGNLTRMVQKEGSKTYVDILDRSMQLFNDFGIESVSIYRVAESMDISPGNLTYHFKRKKNLVDALLNRLENQFIAGLKEFPYTSGAGSFVQAYAELFAISWHHRGIFNSAPYLIQSGLVTASRFRALSNHITTMMVNQTEPLITRGFMERIPPPYNLQILIDCVWWQWLGWLRVNQLREPEQHISFDEIVKSAIDHCIFLVRPYMKKNFPTRLHEAVQELQLVPSNAPRRKTPRDTKKRPAPRRRTLSKAEADG